MEIKNLYLIDPDYEGLKCTLTTARAESSYGQPVLVICDTDTAYGPADTIDGAPLILNPFYAPVDEREYVVSWNAMVLAHHPFVALQVKPDKHSIIFGS
jgi:hypothetical protein